MVLFICLGVATPARAHLMPAQEGTLNFVGDQVFAVVSVPVSAVPEADDNHDGRLSEDEIFIHNKALRAVIQKRLVFQDGDEAGHIVLLNLLAERTTYEAGQIMPPPAGSGARHFLVMQTVQFPTAPTRFTLNTDLFGTLDGEEQLTLKAMRGEDVDVAVLTPLRSAHTFFQSAPQVLGNYVLTGIEHIVFGPDHVLFLLTVIVAGLGWRYWGWVLTSFTIAHSVTLVAGLLGWVQVSPSIVEPLIAASIVWMAALNLWRAYRVHIHAAATAVPKLTGQIGIVFACGLLHGLGFASSMDGMGLHGKHLIASLVGFNVGIELGQITILLAALALMQLGTWLHQRWPRPSSAAHAGGRATLSHAAAIATPLQAPMWVSGVALVFGMMWLVERLMG